MKKYEYLLIDADDTLFDFKRAEHEAFRLTCELGGLKFSDELCRRYSEINDSLWKLLEKGGITLEKLKVERYRRLLLEIGFDGNETEIDSKAVQLKDFYVSKLGEQAFLMPGAEEFCRTMSQKYKLYIVTNGISAVQRKRISLSPIKEYISDIFVSEEIGEAKPHAGYFDYVLDKIGDADKSKYLVIGDSLTSDMRGAVEYGLDSCWVNHKGLTTELKISYNVNNLGDISFI